MELALICDSLRSTEMMRRSNGHAFYEINVLHAGREKEQHKNNPTNGKLIIVVSENVVILRKSSTISLGVNATVWETTTEKNWIVWRWKKNRINQQQLRFARFAWFMNQKKCQHYTNRLWFWFYLWFACYLRISGAEKVIAAFLHLFHVWFFLLSPILC